uniref:Uncharacterized protein n=1 Tax=Arundo donax TaxID=35708 RepID=A0A0A9ADU4_ARUDO
MSEFQIIFFNGMLHMVTSECVIVAVDVEGKVWRTIDMPQTKDAPFDTEPGFIGLSHGRLYFTKTDDIVCEKLAIWVLEDYSSGEWTLKHTISYMHLVRMKYVQFDFGEFWVVSIHPQHNLIFCVFGHDKTLISYDMDSGNVRTIHDLGRSCRPNVIPYVPLFSESLANGKQ